MRTTIPTAYDPRCPDPWHRLYHLIGLDNIRAGVAEGMPWGISVVGSALDLPEHLHIDVIRLLRATGTDADRPEWWAAREANPTLALATLFDAVSQKHGRPPVAVADA